MWDMESNTIAEPITLSSNNPNARYPSVAEAVFEIAVVRAQFLYGWARDILREAAVTKVISERNDVGSAASAENPSEPPARDIAEQYRGATEAVRRLESLLSGWPGDIGADFVNLAEDKCWKQWSQAVAGYASAIHVYRNSVDELLRTTETTK